MRASLVVFSVIGTVFLLAGVSAVEVVNDKGIHFTSDIASSSRKLKDVVIGRGTYDAVKTDTDDPNLDDYQPVDPSPSSKVIRPGPIEHGAPLMPYLPNPAPPPQQGG